MSVAKSFGDLDQATTLVIGHDPRLQHSQAEAEYAFFFGYLGGPRPTYGPSAAKYDLAKTVWDYVSELAGCQVSLEALYVTNLCNTFLAHTPGSGTVLIPDELARRGTEQIAQAVAAGRFKIILPMAVQTFYHLCRWEFIDERSDLVDRFLAGARPQPPKAAQGIYVQSGQAPFLAVCGRRFHHQGVPVVPIVHIKQWPLRARMVKYTGPMQQAQQQVRAVLSSCFDDADGDQDGR